MQMFLEAMMLMRNIQVILLIQVLVPTKIATLMLLQHLESLQYNQAVVHLLLFLVVALIIVVVLQ